MTKTKKKASRLIIKIDSSFIVQVRVGRELPQRGLDHHQSGGEFNFFSSPFEMKLCLVVNNHFLNWEIHGGWVENEPMLSGA